MTFSLSAFLTLFMSTPSRGSAQPNRRRATEDVPRGLYRDVGLPDASDYPATPEALHEMLMRDITLR